MTANHQISSHIQKLYNLKGPITMVVKGLNWTLRIGEPNSPKAFVRLYRPTGRSEQQISEELAALISLQPTKNLSVARPLPTHHGQYYSKIKLHDESWRWIALFEPAPGTPLRPFPADYYQTGCALADLHHQPLGNITRHRRAGLNAGPAIITNTLSRIKIISQPCADILKTALQDFPSSSTVEQIKKTGFNHGDFRPANMLIADQCVTLFDFDDCGVGPHILDLACLAYWLEEDSQNQCASSLWKSFIAGYGLAPGQALQNAITLHMIRHQIRIIRWLMDFCTLEEDSWITLLNSASALARRALAGELKIFSISNPQ